MSNPLTLVRQYEADIFRLALSIVGETGEANEIAELLPR
jgi:hypothetical protein